MTGSFQTEQPEVHGRHMLLALEIAKRALAAGNWPVGAVIARGATVLAMGGGAQATAADPCAHAEINALAQAVRDRTTLDSATIYVTMEPCPMCAWALHLHGISHIVLGARHADLNRTDLGDYTLERFAELMSYRMQLTQDIHREACIDLRKSWGRDRTD